MALVVVFHEAWKRPRIVKGELHNGRPCKWSVEVRFKRPDGEPVTRTYTPNRACTLAELTPFIEEMLIAERKVFGEFTDLGWTATHWR